jgi:hypothetical protein
VAAVELTSIVTRAASAPASDGCRESGNDTARDNPSHPSSHERRASSREQQRRESYTTQELEAASLPPAEQHDAIPLGGPGLSDHDEHDAEQSETDSTIAQSKPLLLARPGADGTDESHRPSNQRRPRRSPSVSSTPRDGDADMDAGDEASDDEGERNSPRSRRSVAAGAARHRRAEQYTELAS